MNVKKAIKRIAALGTGAALMGATVLGAMAADLANFPQPFVRNGQLDAMLIIGQGAQTPDVIGAIDIATTLQYEMRTPATVSGTAAEGRTISVSGDAFRVDLDNTRLTAGQALGDVISTLTDEDLNVLRDTRFDGNDQTHAVSLPNDAGVVMYLASGGFEYDDEPGWYLHYEVGDDIYTYSTDFPSGVVASVSDTSVTGLQDKTLRLLGQEYNVINARRINGGAGLELELMGGDSSDTIEEGATRTYVVDGKSYEVTVVFVGTSGGNVAQLRVNGESTGTIAVGDTRQLADGTEIGIREILLPRVEANPALVEFYIGANKVVLRDGNITNSATTGNLVVGDNTYGGVSVRITGEYTSETSLTLDAIDIEVTADDEYFLRSGDSLSKFIDGDRADYMFGNFDIWFFGMTEPQTQEVRIRDTRDNEYAMQFTTRTGLEYNIPVWVATGGNDGRAGAHGTDDPVLHASGLSDSTNIARRDMFALQTNQPRPEDRTVRIFRYESFSLETGGRGTLRIRDLASGGATREISMREDGGSYVGTARIDGLVHEFTTGNTANSNLNVDTLVDLVVPLRSGSYLNFNSSVANTLNVTLVTPDDLTEATGEEDFVRAIFTAAEGKAVLNIPYPTASVSDVSEDVSLSDGDYRQWYTPFGTRVRFDTSGTRDRADIRVPHRQVLPQVYVTSGPVSTGASGEEVTGDAYDIAKANTGIARLDTEVGTTWRNNNVIVVGGPCVNSVAAELLNSPADNCAEGFTAGRATVRLFEQNNRVAMLVAGYSAADTTRAAQAVARYRDYNNFRGREVEISGTSMANLQVTSVN